MGSVPTTQSKSEKKKKKHLRFLFLFSLPIPWITYLPTLGLFSKGADSQRFGPKKDTTGTGDENGRISVLALFF